MDINRIPPEELGKGSSIVLERCEVEQDMYWKVALELIKIISENNRLGKKP